MSTYLFFESGDDLAGEIVLDVVILVVFVLFFVEAECEWVGGFFGVDEVLATNSVAFGVIVEPTDPGDFVPGFLGDRVVKDDIAIL